jgi:hypothetical protein
MAGAAKRKQRTFRKGARVNWIGDLGKEIHGTVTKCRGGMTEAIADGMKINAKGPDDCFMESDRPPPPPPPSVMDRYNIQGYHKTGGEETVQFSAHICIGRKNIAEASNTGRGGQNFYVGERAVVEKLEDDARQWCKDNGAFDFDPIDQWVTWYIYARPFGGDPKEWFKDIKEEVSDGDPT